MDREFALRVLSLNSEDVKDSDKVKKAYRIIAKAVHPDLQGENSSMFSGIASIVNEAYELLTNNTTQIGSAQVGYGGPSGYYGAAWSNVGSARVGYSGPSGYQGQVWDNVKRRAESEVGTGNNANEHPVLLFSELMELYVWDKEVNTNLGNTVKVTLSKLSGTGATIKGVVTISIRVMQESLDAVNEVNQTVEFEMPYNQNDIYTVNCGLSAEQIDKAELKVGSKVSIVCKLVSGKEYAATGTGIWNGHTRMTIRLPVGIKVYVEI